MKYTPDEVLQYVLEEDVKFVRMAFCDVYGKQRNVAIMAEELPKAGITFREIPRRESGGAPVSASKVRLLLCDGNYEALKDLLPASTLSYFQSPEAEPVLERIRAAEEVVHY